MSNKMIKTAVHLLLLFCGTTSFAPTGIPSLSRHVVTLRASEGNEVSSSSPMDSLVDDVKVRFKILQESNQSGSSFKQTLANVIAGEYDAAPIQDEIEELISSDPCVMFTWEKSPSCVKAVEAFDMMKVKYKVVRLDDPWSKGNLLRAELGNKVGRTSVPFIFIGGTYVGGYDGGVSDEAPGIVSLAFNGTLQDQLKGVGAL